MDWKNLRRSTNVEDRRGMGGGGVAVGGGAAILIALVSILFGANPVDVLNNLQGGGAPSGQYEPTPENERNAEFAARVLGGTEDVWTGLFQKLGRTYDPTTLVLFSGATNAACGSASSATGPFYCPADQKVYIDLSFFDQLEQRFGAGGEFARAYVIAHEVGHHVQQELGIEQRVRELQRQTDQVGANQLSVRLELQADCLAGVWGHHDADVTNLTEKDVRDAMNAAAAIGDDRLSQGRASPDSFTHGSSEQRVTWFLRGFQSGDVSTCDTFATR